MDKKSVQTNNAFVLEEEKTLNWSEVQEAFEKSIAKAKRRVEREKKAKAREEKKTQMASV